MDKAAAQPGIPAIADPRDNRGVKVIVTGGNSGVGKATATALAMAGHEVVIACRDVAKAHTVAAELPGVRVAPLDLANLASVRDFAASVDEVDVLINNAGVMGPAVTRTADGFEAHMGVNHLGHFALTCLLGDRIRDRVISVASAMHALARLPIHDLGGVHRSPSKWKGYSESKLAVLLFTFELARRGVRAYATDPGATDTDIARDAEGLAGWMNAASLPRPYLQTAADGARATIDAVTTELASGTYLAPRFNQWGRPKVTKPRPKALDPAMARRLWSESVELTGCDWSRSL